MDTAATPPAKSPTRIPAGSTQLLPKQRLLLEYMVHGCRHDYVRRLTRAVSSIDNEGNPVVTTKPIEPGTPLTVEEAAELLNLRRRYARQLLSAPLFAQAMAAEVQRLRTGEHARSVHKIIALRDDPGAGKAADRKVQLAAAQAILGEGDAASRGTTVNVNLGVTQITAGIVVRLPAAAPAHLQPTSQDRTIEHEAKS